MSEYLKTDCRISFFLQAADLCLVLVSALKGTQIGHPVTFNLTTQGTLIGPLLHETRMGAYYILFGLGKVCYYRHILQVYTQQKRKEHFRLSYYCCCNNNTDILCANNIASMYPFHCFLQNVKD